MIGYLLRRLQARLQKEKRDKLKRRVSFGDLVTDRWQNAREYGFGEGTSCYDNVLVLGNVKVGRNCWIGPNVVLDGSGGLEIGDNCSISAGAQLYSHHTLEWATGMGEKPYDYAPTCVGSGVYIGPNAVIQKGVTIGDNAVVGALSLVRTDVPSGAHVYGVPARIQSPDTDEQARRIGT
jgi:acetyltransferase-like isoleucine patch superfamily enzyme